MSATDSAGWVEAFDCNQTAVLSITATTAEGRYKKKLGGTNLAWVHLLTLSRIGIRLPDMPKDPAELLRHRGLQVTAQRLAVLRVLARRPHSTADEVAGEVRTEIGTISRQAVYDALGSLAEKGLIRRIQPAGSAARYEDRVGDNHHHLICRVCGKTVDVDCAVGAMPCLTPVDGAGYRIEEAEVIYWGTCPKCLSASRGTTRD